MKDKDGKVTNLLEKSIKSLRENLNSLSMDSLGSGQENSLQLIEKENERNFNRILLDILSESYSDVGIDINMSTVQLLESLKGTSVKEEHLNKILTEIYEKN